MFWKRIFWEISYTQLSGFQPVVSEHWKKLKALTPTRENHSLASSFLHPAPQCQGEELCCLYFLFYFHNWHCRIESSPIDSARSFVGHLTWWRGIVISGIRRTNKVTARLARLVPGWVTHWPSLGVYTISVCNKPTRSTQPCIPPGSLNRLPASAGVRAGMSPLPGGR